MLALTAAKFGTIPKMRFGLSAFGIICLWSAGVGNGAGVGAAVRSFGWIPTSDRNAEAPELPDCWVCWSCAEPSACLELLSGARRVPETE
jgi:hypothetical protein